MIDDKANERQYFDALKQITRYQRIEQFKNSRKRWGIEPSEAIEMAYENVIEVARGALKGKRRPPELAIARAAAKAMGLEDL